jgi:hypothetical protein
VLQPLAVQCRPATLPSAGHRWGAAGPRPCPRAGRQTGVITCWATRSGGLAPRGGCSQAGASCSAATARGTPLVSPPLPLRGGARSDPAGVLLGHVPGRDGRQGPSPGGRPGPAAWPQGRVIAGRSELQCCNRSRCSVGRRRCRAEVTGGALLEHGQVPGRGGAPGSSPGGARSGPVEHAAGRCISLDVAVRQ